DSIDPATGAVTFIGGITHKGVGAIAIRPSTRVLYGVGQDFDNNSRLSLMTINTSTGAPTVIGILGLESSPTPCSVYSDCFVATDISFRPSDGTLFAFLREQDQQDPGALYTVNLTTGAPTLVGATGLAGSAIKGGGMSFSGATLYFAAGTSLYTLNQSAG